MNDVDLFDVRRKAARAKAPAAPAGAVQHLLSLYRAGYERRFHEPPVILKRDGALLKSLIKQFGQEKVEARLKAFLAWDDSFVVDSGFALSLLHSCWNRLAAKCVQAAPASSRDDQIAASSAAMLTEIRDRRRQYVKAAL